MEGDTIPLLRHTIVELASLVLLLADVNQTPLQQKVHHDSKLLLVRFAMSEPEQEERTIGDSAHPSCRTGLVAAEPPTERHAKRLPRRYPGYLLDASLRCVHPSRQRESCGRRQCRQHGLFEFRSHLSCVLRSDLFWHRRRPDPDRGSQLSPRPQQS